MVYPVIVVGGGPVGLVAAHALSRAGVDFLLLEGRPDIVFHAGSDLVLTNSGMRVLNQLALLEPLDKVSTDLDVMQRVDHQGRNIGDIDFLAYQKEFFGLAPRVLSRHDISAVFYDSLPGSIKSRLLPNKRVASLASNANGDGVVVTCRDGSVYEASLVIGADGAHSIVRQQMRELAVQHNATLPADSMPAPVNDEQPFLTTFRCLWLRFPSVSAIPVGTTSETHGPIATTQLFAAEDTTVLALYERLDTPTRDRIHYTQADQDSVAARWGNLLAAKGSDMTIAQAWAARTESGLVNLEEGVVENWSFDGRVVLTGDAAHKFTPSTGAGCNNGIVDIVALVNELYPILPSSASPDRPMPGKHEVASALQRYQSKRHGAVTAGCAYSGQVTKSSSWADWQSWLVDRYVLQFKFVQRRLALMGATRDTAKTPVFSFIEGVDRKGGSVPWIKQMKAPTVVKV
ncbi:uncharacterized protein B0I36DRAFT_242279 [Microdochium trichocladiopsis]|uniref:FAD-binding domain-containing protein n=1 Tax=Microdochium trichocladiopsis TaxID=1682393 RepID=A0A9P8Y6Z6_9PEZI|nr:uncharacterized protein B0I36DRAFT_242279 [Microdochium trichocladiopsis]KAH7031451.1 hypothetical protein B0I36DRAFT_242279 [Microdochium trichocladiopsis]